MVESGGARFDPLRLRTRLAERDESYAAFLAAPLYADEAAAVMPGLAEWHTYRGLPREVQEPAGLASADFAAAYRDVPHPAGILDRKRSA
jgi:hypothetical protein